MRITFYDTRISNDDTVMLVKERAMNYAIENISNPSDAATLINKVTHLNEMAEEYGYMISTKHIIQTRRYFCEQKLFHSISKNQLLFTKIV